MDGRYSVTASNPPDRPEQVLRVLKVPLVQMLTLLEMPKRNQVLIKALQMM